MKYTMKCKISLGNKVTISNLAQRHNFKTLYNKPKSEVTFLGKQSNFKALESDRGWQQFKEFNHIRNIKIKRN